MNVTDFIGRCIDTPDIPLEKCSPGTVCAFSGQVISVGVPKRIAIKPTFNDLSYLAYQSEYISRNAFVCIARIKAFGRSDFELRKYHFLVTDSDLLILKRDQLQEILLNPPSPPFVFSVTASNKKHRAFKARIATNTNQFPVELDNMTCIFDRERAFSILPILREWYTVLPGKGNTEVQPTWFNKQDMLHGCNNPKKVAAYGINRYFKQSQELENYRRAPWFALLVFTLNKVKK